MAFSVYKLPVLIRGAKYDAKRGEITNLASRISRTKAFFILECQCALLWLMIGRPDRALCWAFL